MTKIITAPIGIDEIGHPHGWMYIAWLAYPMRADASKRHEFWRMSCALPFKAQRENGGLGKQAPDGLKGIKNEKVRSVVARGIGRAARRMIGPTVFFTCHRHGISINDACKRFTQHDPWSDDELTLWPRPSDSDADAPEGNVRRAFYDAQPVLPMMLALPMFPQGLRESVFGDLATSAFARREMQEVWATHDWLAPACRDAQRIASILGKGSAFETSTFVVPNIYRPNLPFSAKPPDS